MIDNFREWLSDNLRYILLGLAVLLVIIIGVCIFRLIGGSSSKKRASGKKTTAVTTSQKDEASTESAGSGSVPSASGSLTQDEPDLLKLAQKYYKDYRKLRTAADVLKRLIVEGEEEAEYFRQVQYEIGLASTEEEFIDIRKELRDAGYLKGFKYKERGHRKSDPFFRYRASTSA